ncbi:hypothetical protein FQA39_LY02554 [Lamprigera yunnana]|nr:hypothetical protein FQA39_LY02554 [Lamprigera yunnana]
MELSENATNEFTTNVCKLTEDKILIENKNTFDSDIGNEDNSTNFNAVTVIDVNQEILTELIEAQNTDLDVATFVEDCNIQTINPCRSFDVEDDVSDVWKPS